MKESPTPSQNPFRGGLIGVVEAFGSGAVLSVSEVFLDQPLSTVVGVVAVAGLVDGGRRYWKSYKQNHLNQ